MKMPRHYVSGILVFNAPFAVESIFSGKRNIFNVIHKQAIVTKQHIVVDITLISVTECADPCQTIISSLLAKELVANGWGTC
jgi:hypothetical protein